MEESLAITNAIINMPNTLQLSKCMNLGHRKPGRKKDNTTKHAHTHTYVSNIHKTKKALTTTRAGQISRKVERLCYYYNTVT